MDNNLIEVIKIADKNPQQKILKKDSEERVYLLCIAGKDGGEDYWELVTGRTDAYTTIKDTIEFIDLERSFILVETAKLMDRKSIVAFMKYAEQFYNDSFDIDDYIKGDWNEEEYQQQNDIDNLFLSNDNNKLEMENFMDGNINSRSLE